ncbi:hypothetical protein F2P81_023001 [Scophthalmus maximus]|uniref:Uncharacterized protein n=1 Tax=Scophthalmus maximus TaxID=52904 RepID=A0A6A4RV89_SCOMX|nr:hypothetical protein F2P81_023001 [Scophthalmus maximus]
MPLGPRQARGNAQTQQTQEEVCLTSSSLFFPLRSSDLCSINGRKNNNYNLTRVTERCGGFSRMLIPARGQRVRVVLICSHALAAGTDAKYSVLNIARMISSVMILPLEEQLLQPEREDEDYLDQGAFVKTYFIGVESPKTPNDAGERDRRCVRGPTVLELSPGPDIPPQYDVYYSFITSRPVGKPGRAGFHVGFRKHVVIYQ